MVMMVDTTLKGNNFIFLMPNSMYYGLKRFHSTELTRIFLEYNLGLKDFPNLIHQFIGQF